MSGSVNKVILVGNVGKDPEIRSTQDGKELASFSIATSETWRDKLTGERKERTEWHRIVVFSEGLVNVVKNYVKKGSRLYIEGALQTRKWTDNNGSEKYTTEIVLQGFNSTLVMIDSRNSSEYSAGHGGNMNSEFDNTASRSSNFEQKNEFIADDIGDEIPF